MNETFYIGSYTDYPPAVGLRTESIYQGQVDPITGKLTLLEAFDGGKNVSFLAFHPNRRWLFAANEQAEGAVSAFVLENGRPRILNQQLVKSADPCYLGVDSSGRWLVAACYSGGSLSVLPIGEDGRLGPLAERVQHTGSGLHPNQDKAHAHSAMFDPSGRFLLSTDLGMDRVFVYHMDPQTGHLALNQPPGLILQPGAGPRHLVFHPNGPWLFISNELDSTVTACRWESHSGHLEVLQTLSTLPPDFNGKNDVADIHLSHSGDYLYVSNRGENSVAAYRVDAATGRLEWLANCPCGGNWPRNFTIDPSGRWILAANQRSQTVTVLSIRDDGRLEPTGIELVVPAPVFVSFA